MGDGGGWRGDERREAGIKSCNGGYSMDESSWNGLSLSLGGEGGDEGREVEVTATTVDTAVQLCRTHHTQ